MPRSPDTVMAQHSASSASRSVVDCWPIGIGHPCVGCTEQAVAFRIPMHTTIPIDRPTPPDTYAPVHAPQGRISPVATAVAGTIGGALIGAGYVASRKLDAAETEDQPSGPKDVAGV